MASEKTYQSATQAFLEFEHRFARLSDQEQRLVGEDKVLMFVRSIDRKERMDIGIKLEDKDGANGLIEDWAEVKRVCRRHDEKRTGTMSATTQPTSGGRKWVTSDERLPPKASLMRKGSEMHDKSQVDIEGEPKMETKARQTMDDEEVTSQQLRRNDVANTKTKVRYDGTKGEGVEPIILSSCGETMAKDKADDLR